MSIDHHPDQLASSRFTFYSRDISMLIMKLLYWTDWKTKFYIDITNHKVQNGFIGACESL